MTISHFGRPLADYSRNLKYAQPSRKCGSRAGPSKQVGRIQITTQSTILRYLRPYGPCPLVREGNAYAGMHLKKLNVLH